MDIGTLLVLGGVSLLYLALGVWAVSQIFPAGRSSAGTSHADVGADRDD